MDIISIFLFFIYSLIILGILVYVSPLLSAFFMIFVPVVSVYFSPDEAIRFFSISQFSYYGIQVFNLHILLLIWSAFIGIIAYAEILTWYLLRMPEPGSGPASEIKEALPVIGDKPKTLWFKVRDFTRKLYKILKGEKIKVKP